MNVKQSERVRKGRFPKKTAERVMAVMIMAVAVAAGAAFGEVRTANLLDEVRVVDRRADAEVAALTAQTLTDWQAEKRKAWLSGLGGLPERTPLNAKSGPVTRCAGFTLQNVLFESMPGVYVVGHLALPDTSDFKPPYPAVLMPMGHSDAGIIAPRYAAHLAMMARAGFAAFSWDPISQGERRQSKKEFDYTDSCSTEHTRLGARGWLVGWNFARFRIWDGMRALDYLETRKDIDCTKVGVCGTSGGGTMSAYLQALDPRITVAFPNCYISSIRAVFAERGCHDAEQFFWNQQNVGVNHAAILSMGAGRVSLATGSRWKDYFPQKGAEETFAVYSNMVYAVRHETRDSSPSPLTFTCSPWHFHCDGPHGLSLPTRQAQVDWMSYCIRGGVKPKPLADYWKLSTGDHSGANDPSTNSPLPFPANAAFFTPSHQVRDLPGFRSVYEVIADQARALAKARDGRDRRDGRDMAAKYREIVRRRAGIRPLSVLLQTIKQSNNQTILPFDHPKFGWWYLKGTYGCRRENEAAMLATLGRSVVGRDAERIILDAASYPPSAASFAKQSGYSGAPRPQVLRASGWNCIAAAHAYAAEPQLFAGVEFTDPPPSWTEMVTNPDPKNDSYAIGVWGALEEYDWTDLAPAVVKTSSLPGQGEDKLYDGKFGPTCAWAWKKKPIEIVTDFGETREIAGVRFWAGRSWISKGVKKASFYRESGALGERALPGDEPGALGDRALPGDEPGALGDRALPVWEPLAEHVEFRPAHTFKQSYATWKPIKCRRVKMVIEDAWEPVTGYYMWYMHLATPRISRLFDSPPYTINDRKNPHVEIAELEYFDKEPWDLPKPNAELRSGEYGALGDRALPRDESGALGDRALPAGAEWTYPKSRLVFDWALQSCAVSNVSHCANVEPDTTKPDPLGESLAECYSVSQLSHPSQSSYSARQASRREFLKGFRAICDEFVYVKHLVIGNSIMHATDDMTDASFLEWKSVPDYKTGSQLLRAKIHEDGTVTQQVLVDEPKGIIRDPSLAVDASYVVFSKRSSMTTDNYHLWKYEFASGKLTQLTDEPVLCARDARTDALTWRDGAFVPGQTNAFKFVCADTEPCVLPDGSIVFQSTRVCHSVDCWPLPTTNLYRCDPDGSNIRRIGFDQIQTFYPQLLEDGRIAYTRWEYQDRSASGLQQLYAMNPDGTRQMGLFANNSEWPFSLIHCRGVPGTDKLVALSAGHHAAQKGKFVELNPSEGDDYDNQTYDPAKSIYGMNTNDIVYTDFPGGAFTVKWTPYDNPCGPAVTNVPGMYYLAGASMDCHPGRVPAKHPKDYHYNVYDMHSQFGPQWAYPFALDDGHYLVSYMPEGCRYYRGPYSSRFGIYAVDKSGRRELLAFDWDNHCMQPVALKARPHLAGRKVKKLDYTKGFGTYYVQDVYHGAAVKGLKRGSVKKIRVIALEYRPVHNGWNWQYGWHSSQGKIGTPISVGNGAYDVKHVFGEADVEADGSCMFVCPSRAPVYFQLIDADGLCLQTMRSWTTLMPGESNSCIGCHEHPNEAAPLKATIASKKPPQRLKSAIPGRPRHPLLERLEKEGPLASLENWMGVNRPMKTPVEEIAAKGIPAEERGDGIGFVKDIQPIFDRLLRDYPNEKILGLDLRDVPAELPVTDDKSMRTYSKSYLGFTEKGKGTDNVNFAHGLSFAAFKPPCSFGAIRSKWYWALAPRLTDSERRTLAMWIDLAIPYCSAYTERHTWDAWHQQRYLYTYDKRIFSYWLELDEIRKSLGLPSVPMTGFVPNVTEPRKQRRWDE